MRVRICTSHGYHVRWFYPAANQQAASTIAFLDYLSSAAMVSRLYHVSDLTGSSGILISTCLFRHRID